MNSVWAWWGLKLRKDFPQKDTTMYDLYYEYCNWMCPKPTVSFRTFELMTRECMFIDNETLYIYRPKNVKRWYQGSLYEEKRTIQFIRFKEHIDHVLWFQAVTGLQLVNAYPP